MSWARLAARRIQRKLTRGPTREPAAGAGGNTDTWAVGWATGRLDHYAAQGERCWGLGALTPGWAGKVGEEGSGPSNRQPQANGGEIPGVGLGGRTAADTSIFIFILGGVCFKVNFLVIKWSLYHDTTVSLWWNYLKSPFKNSLSLSENYLKSSDLTWMANTVLVK